MSGSRGDDLELQNIIVEGNSMRDDDGNLHSASPESGDAYENRSRKRSMSQTKMYQAAFEGNWQAAKIVLRIHPNVARERITERGDTALHVAAATKQLIFVRKLVKKMAPDDLLVENDFGFTAFLYAAASGSAEIAAVMREKNKNVVAHRNQGNMTPIYVAAMLGHTDMVSYLYEITSLEDLSMDELFDLLLATTEKKMYDVALTILRSNKSLAIMSKKGESPLRLLAQQDISDISSCKEAFLERLVSTFAAYPRLSWLKRICEQPLMRKRALLLAQTLWDEIQRLEEPDLFHQLFTESPILHDAAKLGNVGFINMLTRKDPDLIFKRDSNGHTIFHIAVLHRQENVFSLIHKLGAMKDGIMMLTDKGGNNILHLAQELADPRILKNVPGVALQMQRELMWYTEVKKIVPVLYQRTKNDKGQLPTELFSLNHEKLLKEGEKGMKETANSCMLTATLTATVVFAAAFTVPGGINENTGTPILLGRGWFTVFMGSDAAAMFFSTFSIIMFLAILTSRFQEDDFLVSLPRKLILGLTTLFASIVSTIVAFTSTCILLFTKERAWAPILFATIACFSLTILFIRFHFKLWIDTIRSTYLSRPLLHRGKYSLW